MGLRALLAGIDIGTTHVKVGVFDESGRRVAVVRRPTPRELPGLVAAVSSGLAECAAHAGQSPRAIGIAGMAETGVPLNRSGRPLAPLLWWNDPRGAEEIAVLERDAAALYALTGRRPDAKAPLAKWLWLRAHAPAVLARMRWWASVPDAVAYALTGSLRTHETLAARTLAYDVTRRRYDEDLLGMAGLRPDQLPATAGAVEPVGKMTADVAGVMPGIPVVIAGHDHAVGAWAAGVRRPGHVADSLGTAEAVMAPAAARPDPRAALALGVTADPSLDGAGTVLVGGLPTSGGLIDWLLDLLTSAGTGGRRAGPPDRTTDAPDGPEGARGEPAPGAEPGGAGAFPASQGDLGAGRYAVLSDLLAGVGLPTGILVEPYLRGRAAPAPDRELRVTLSGLGPEHAPADLLAAAIEGTCLHVRWIVEELTALSGVVPGRLVVFGGQVRIPLWMRIKAAVSPVPVDVVRAGDAVCAGAALIAGQAGGSLRAVPVLPAGRHPSEAALATAYAHRYERFLHRQNPRQEPS